MGVAFIAFYSALYVLLYACHFTVCPKEDRFKVINRQADNAMRMTGVVAFLGYLLTSTIWGFIIRLDESGRLLSEDTMKKSGKFILVWSIIAAVLFLIGFIYTIIDPCVYYV